MFSRFFSKKPSRKLVLISLDWTRQKDPPLSLGHASILANLKHHQIPVIAKSWAVNHTHYRYEETRDFILDQYSENMDVAFGAFVWNESAVQRIITDLKKQLFSGRIIIGGPQVSYVKSGIERYYPLADVFIRGYAEQALADLMLANKPNTTIKGVHYAGTTDLGLSALPDLESLPSPYLTGMIKPQPFIRWETQRGCPFHCAFCQHRESDASMTRRHLSLSRILREAEWITSHPVINDLAILDPTFNAGPHYLTVLDKLIEGRYTGKIALQCRAEMINEAFLNRVSTLNKTGRVVLEFGLQTAIRQEQININRINNLKKIQAVFAELQKRDIESEISLIFGLPGQTVSTFEESIRFCKTLGASIIHAFPLMLLRGTPLYDKKDAYGLVESTEHVSAIIDRVQQDIPHVVESHSFTYQDWRKMVLIAEQLEEENKPYHLLRKRYLSS